ncbi:MAG: glycine/sarcosine/betaine reductase selenoprotein B family protein [Actinomycetota bacterium]|nr:glycine/sarcosine/betaine reductase selenoprotein B family protein [Actinomycetota bacterium]
MTSTDGTGLDDDSVDFPALERDFVRRFVPTFEWVSYPRPSPRQPLQIPLTQARVGLISTAGVHQAGEAPLRSDGEARMVPLDGERLALDHVGYDTQRASADPEVVFPAQTLLAMADDGLVASVAPLAVSTMGFVPKGADIFERTLPVARDSLRDQEVDLALLVPA